MEVKDDFMDVVLLCAGYGTRLSPLTDNTPKALLPVAGKPILEYLLSCLKDREDVSSVVLVSNHKFFDTFKLWLKENGYTYVKLLDDGSTSNDDRKGAIGDLLFAIEECNLSDNLLVVGGDNIWEEGLSGFLDFAKRKNEICIGIYDLGRKDLAKEFGVVLLNDDGKVVEFEEKPSNPKSSLIGMCLYYFPKQKLVRIYDYWNDKRNPRDAIGYFLKFLVERDDVFGYVFGGRWFDIGSISAYEEANRFFESQKGNN